MYLTHKVLQIDLKMFKLIQSYNYIQLNDVSSIHSLYRTIQTMESKTSRRISQNLHFSKSITFYSNRERVPTKEASWLALGMKTIP